MTAQEPIDASPGTSDRRCWRCLQMFANEQRTETRPAEFWLCELCQRKLLPSKRQPSG